MSRIRLTLPVLALALLVSAADPRSDTERLQGAWAMVSLEIDGELVTEEQVATGTLTVEKDRYTPIYGGKSYPETFTVNPGATPKAIDFTYSDGPRKGETVKGIYKLEGDRYIMCRALRAEDGRPTEFATTANSERALVVWKRAKPAEPVKP